MPVASMASFKEAKEREKKARMRKWKRMQRRYLGGKVYTCFYQHLNCDHCIFLIVPGEQYRRDRYVQSHADGRTRFWYERAHWPCCYGPTDEEDREIREAIERQHEEKESEAKRRAA